MRKLVFATNNTHKLEEARAILEPEYKIISLVELDCNDDIPETATTLEGNSLLKAKYIYEKFGLDCFADDTGLEVAALNGEPGVYSARYAGEQHNPVENMRKVLQLLGDNKNRLACFRTVISLIMDGDSYFFEGRINGSIGSKPVGMNGFGYDPIFIPENHELTFALLGPEEKNKISHRARALQSLVSFLKKN